MIKIRHLIRWATYFIYRNDPRATAMIGVTYFCQLNCLHCGMALYAKNKREEMSKDELIETINRLSINKIKGVYFFGGEPLLRNDIFELINCAHKKGFVTILDTNGYLLTEGVTKKLKNAGLQIIEISIDSPYPEIHNRLRRRKDSFQRAIKGIKNCLNNGITCYLSTYATKENLKNGDLERIILLGEKLGVGYIRILFPLLTGKWLGKEEIRLNEEEGQLLKKFHQFGFVRLEGESCGASKKKSFYISPYGEIQPCCYIPFSFGNIREEPLKKILKRMWKHPMYKMKIKGCPVADKEFQKEYYSKLTPTTKLPVDLSKDD